MTDSGAPTLPRLSEATVPSDGERRDGAPAEVGRYQIVGELGRGAYGSVYEGFDPRLERRVAIKVLQSDLDGEAARLRQVREGQALAQLADPNVVQVFDVGVVGETQQVYIAMELIEGFTLGEWLRDAPRSPDEIIAVLRGAARGLAAAHRADIVHRDFKPANILVTHGGVAKVVDFGLARASPSLSSSGAGTTLSDVELLADVTATGTLMGTPFYMPPEVIRGGDWSPAGDQFSFCVTLYEALFGERPFDGRTFEILATNISANRRSDAPTVRVPTSVNDVLDRGLDPDPDRRFESMEALVSALRPRRGAKWRNVGVVFAGGLVALGLVATALSQGPQHVDDCASAPESCEAVDATPGDAPPPPAAIADAVRAMRARLEQVEVTADRDANDPAASLEALLVDVRALGYGPLTADVLHGLALRELGERRVEQAVEHLREAVDVANRSGYEVATSWIESDLCRALGQEGDREEDALRHCEHAIATAQRFGREELRGRAIGQRGKIYRHLGRLAEARADAELAHELIERELGPTNETTLRSKGNLANVLVDQGQLRRALELTREVVDGFAGRFGEDHPATLNGMHNLAALQLELGDLAAGERTLTDTLARYEAIYGPKHATLRPLFLNLVELETRRERFAQARAYVARAQALDFGDDVGGRRARLSVAEKFAGLSLAERDYPEAQRRYKSVLDDSIAIFGTESAGAAWARFHLGLAFADAEQHEQGRRHLRDAAEIALKLELAGTPAYADLFKEWARSAQALGDRADAERALRHVALGEVPELRAWVAAR